MDALMQGTTPSIEITINTDDFLLSDVTAIKLPIQNGENLTTYEMADLTIDTENNKLIKTFTESETTALSPKSKLIVQGRFWLVDGTIVGIEKLEFSVSDMLGLDS